MINVLKSIHIRALTGILLWPSFKRINFSSICKWNNTYCHSPRFVFFFHPTVKTHKLLFHHWWIHTLHQPWWMLYIDVLVTMTNHPAKALWQNNDRHNSLLQILFNIHISLSLLHLSKVQYTKQRYNHQNPQMMSLIARNENPIPYSSTMIETVHSVPDLLYLYSYICILFQRVLITFACACTSKCQIPR